MSYDYAIMNEDLETCVEALVSIVRAARCRVSHVAERRPRHRAHFRVGQGDEQSMSQMLSAPGRRFQVPFHHRGRPAGQAAPEWSQAARGQPQPQADPHSRRGDDRQYGLLGAQGRGASMLVDPGDRGRGASGGVDSCRWWSSASPGASLPTRLARSFASCSGARWTSTW